MTVLLGLFAAEVGTRALDGFALLSIRLVRTSTPRTKAAAPVDRQYALAVPRAAGVNIGWYIERPPAIPAIPLSPELQARVHRYPSEPWSAFFEWNLPYLRQQACRPVRDVTLGALDDFYYFEPTQPDSIFPPYRHLRHINPPGWFVTNAFGWRGPDVPLNKPDNTIRIAFVGASTTVDMFGAPFSHPEMIGYWLNRWAETRGASYRFDVINAGRNGINSTSIAAVVEEELLPVEPDLVVYYEGANQLWPDRLVTVDSSSTFDRPRTTYRPRSNVEEYSAVVARALTLWQKLTVRGGFEPRKPRSRVNWPADVDERDPRIDSPTLPMDLPNIIASLEKIRKALDGIDAELVMSSFVWIVYDGMRLDMARDLNLYNYLNQIYWPFTYAEMRRIADFQNRVFEKYARIHDLPFIDVAAEMPQDPALTVDAIHFRYEGLALQAWIYVQHLIPLIEERVKDGRLPKPARVARAVHPAFDQPTLRHVTLEELRKQCP